MVKIGPAFFDYVNEEKVNRRRSFGNFVPSDFLAFVPVFFLMLIFAVITARIFYIQVLRSEYYKGLSDNNRTRTEIIPAPRGIIYDRRGRPLISNSATFTIKENGKDKVINQQDALKLISDKKNINNTVTREYLYKSAFAHVLGYVGKVSENEVMLPQFSEYGNQDFVGKIGLEKQYEPLLHGTNGKKIYEVDATGQFMRELGRQDPVPGLSLKTTLDLDVQKAVADAMRDVDRGAVIVSDPKTGGIMALYSSPTFDPNLFTYGKSYKAEGKYTTTENVLLDSTAMPLLDRSISGRYPPGSTFKLVTAVAALQKGAMKADTQIEDTGILKVGTFSFGNWYFLQYGKTDGMVDMVAAIKRSNDIYFYKAAEATGVDTISSWARDFGLGSLLGIDLPGEIKGTVPTKEWKQKVIGEPWYLGDTYNYGIGQGYLLTTPLQINMMTDVFANDGILYQPHLNERDKKVLKKDFIKKENIELVREGMRQSCDTGGVAFSFFDFKVKNANLKIDNMDYFQDASAGAQMASGPGGLPARWVRVKVGCKTGTAETQLDQKPNAWITVFAPYYKPEVVVTVLVENGGEGSSVAGPIAAEILRDYFEKK